MTEASGSDLRIDLALTDAEMAAGTTRDLDIHRELRCTSCDGAGGSDLRACTACDGAGELREPHGDLLHVQRCPACDGRTQVPAVPCKACTHGFVLTRQTITVTVPAGVEPGQMLRLAGRGNEGPAGTPNGFLYVALEAGRASGAAEVPRARVHRRGGFGFAALIVGVVLVAMLVHLAGCGEAAADKNADGVKLAKDDLIALVAKEKVPGVWELGDLYWDSSAKHTRADAHIVLKGDGDPLLQGAPFATGGNYYLDLGPPAKLISKPAAKDLADTASHAADFDVALGLARAELHKQQRYSYWQKEKWKYETRLYVSKGHIFVSFDTPNVTDQDIVVEIDPAAKKVIAVRLGMA